MVQAGFLKLGKSDFLKALLMGVISIVISVGGDAVLQSFTTGGYSLDAIHWKEIGGAVGVAILTYLKKNFLSNEDGKFLKKDELTLDK